MDAQQTQQTEKLIEEMLEFLETTSDEEEEEEGEARLEKTPNCKAQINRRKSNGHNSKEKNTTLQINGKKDKKSKSCLAKELSKLKEEFPIWNTKEIVSNSKKSISLPQSPICAEEQPIWRGESSLSLVDKLKGPVEADVLPEDDGSDWYARSDVKSRDNSDTIYVQEVRKAIYGNTQGHPVHDTPEYHEAAQTYAVYGKDFLDFPSNINVIIRDQTTCPIDNGHGQQRTFGSVEYAANQGVQGGQTQEAFNINNFGKPQPNNTSQPGCTSTSGAPPTMAAVASTAAYYQLCNGLQQRPGAANNAVGATTYGMFLGNKVTYLAATPTAPTLMYNQQNATTANFISNSLANAALATSPAILYSNPMLNATTQQYLNAFFKETQLLNSGGSNSNQTTSTAFYERLVYAQMLQQQIYHQNQQQAAAVAAMIQHKQRVNAAAVAAAAAAVAAARQTSGGSTNASTTNGSNGIQTLCNTQASVAAGGASTTLQSLKQCGRQSPMVTNGSADVMPLKQQGNGITNQTAIAVNGSEGPSNAIKE